MATRSKGIFMKLFASTHLACLLLTASFALSSAACGEEEIPAVDCATVAVPVFSDVAAFASCNGCHSSAVTGADRQGAPVNIDFDTYDSAVANIDKAMEEVAEGAMPPNGALATADADALYAWGQCGKPQ